MHLYLLLVKLTPYESEVEVMIHSVQTTVQTVVEFAEVEMSGIHRAPDSQKSKKRANRKRLAISYFNTRVELGHAMKLIQVVCNTHA